MHLPLEVGRKYKTRDGRRALIVNTEVLSGGEGNICVLVRNLKQQNPTDKIYVLYDAGTYRAPGGGEHDLDLVDDWIDPVFNWSPVWKNHHSPVRYTDRVAALNEGASGSTEIDPLIGLLKIEINSGEAYVEKPGINVLQQEED